MTSKFVKVKCEKCKNEQMVFVKAASKVKCLVCGEILAEPAKTRSTTSLTARINAPFMSAQRIPQSRPRISRPW